MEASNIALKVQTPYNHRVSRTNWEWDILNDVYMLYSIFCARGASTSNTWLRINNLTTSIFDIQIQLLVIQLQSLFFQLQSPFLELELFLFQAFPLLILRHFWSRVLLLQCNTTLVLLKSFYLCFQSGLHLVCDPPVFILIYFEQGTTPHISCDI